MTWPRSGGANSYQTCEDIGHRFGAHFKWVDEKKRIFVRGCRKCTCVYIGQIKLVENDSAAQAKVVQLNPDETVVFKEDVEEVGVGEYELAKKKTEERMREEIGASPD